MKPSVDTQLAKLRVQKEETSGRLREIEERIASLSRKKENEGERTIRTRALKLANYGMAEEGEVMERHRAGIPAENIASEFGISAIRVRRIILTHTKEQK